MTHAMRVLGGWVCALALGGCITSSGPGGGPPPVGNVDAAKLYTGDWHEIAYRPNWVTQGCVAGVTRFTPGEKAGEVHVRDSCREKTVDGNEKVVEGTGHILDPNSKIRTDYFLFVSRETWAVAVAPDYSWYITSTPDFGEINIFTRDPQISDALKAELTAKVKAWGYDVAQLVFPAQPAR